MFKLLNAKDKSVIDNSNFVKNAVLYKDMLCFHEAYSQIMEHKDNLPNFCYLKGKEISMCIGGDYFGYGYLSAIAIAEKYFEDKNPPKDKRVLKPIKYKVYQTSEFDKNWNSLFR